MDFSKETKDELIKYDLYETMLYIADNPSQIRIDFNDLSTIFEGKTITSYIKQRYTFGDKLKFKRISNDATAGIVYLISNEILSIAVTSKLINAIKSQAGKDPNVIYGIATDFKLAPNEIIIFAAFSK